MVCAEAAVMLPFLRTSARTQWDCVFVGYGLAGDEIRFSPSIDLCDRSCFKSPLQICAYKVHEF